MQNNEEMLKILVPALKRSVGVMDHESRVRIMEEEVAQYNDRSGRWTCSLRDLPLEDGKVEKIFDFEPREDRQLH